jgi:two-component system, NarL family, response regulator
MSPVAVLIVEDNMLTRAGVSSVLSAFPGIEVVGQASGGAEALKLYAELAPQVVVSDLRMPEMDGVELVTALVKQDASARVLVLTHYDGEENIFRAIHAGALGYVTKDANADVLVSAIQTVAKGERFLPAAIAAKFAARSMSKGLSPREQQVLELVQNGLANKEIAHKLGLTDKTVQLYVATIMEKLGVHSRTEAVAVATDRGFLMPRR